MIGWITAIPGALKLVPRWVWYALAVAAAYHFASVWYHKQITAAEQRGHDRAVEDGKKLAKKTDDKTGKITTNIRGKTDEAQSRIRSTANDQRLRGPGAARCPTVSSTTGEHHPPSGQPDAARPDVPSEDRAAVPWDWLVKRAEQCDLNRAEVLAWREWHDRVLDAWPKSQPEKD